MDSSARDKDSATLPSSGTPLFAAHKKVYMRATSGVFARWRWILVWFTQLVFYGLPWLTWNNRQAVLFHLTERKAYIFGGVFWPQDALFLALLLIISAYALFFFTAVAGRLWCGYACPQTVYTEIFMWIEEKIEGGHVQRMKLDRQPMGAKKFALKSMKYAVWAVVALWTGFTFVAYFSPLKDLLRAAATFSFGPWELFWIIFYGSFTYAFAGILREQVCKYMCPYARFQGVMFDPNTLIITYDEERGEPRGARRKGVEPKSIGKGDCVDCGICVQVCPTGIDIRQGLQYECIGCAACIDACDQVMDKMAYPRGLIRYSTENALKQRWGRREILTHVLRPRTLVYSVVLVLFCVGFAWGLATRNTIRVDIIRDRASLGRELGDGQIENIYRLHLMNMTERPRVLEISVSGLRGVQIRDTQKAEIGPTMNKDITLQVLAPPDAGKPGANVMFFEIRADDEPARVLREKTTFFFPQ